MRHRLPQFAHIFAGDGYSAGYYSYLWADTLSADAFEAFTEGKGPYDPAVARRLKELVFSAGNTVDPALVTASRWAASASFAGACVPSAVPAPFSVNAPVAGPPRFPPPPRATSSSRAT